MSAILSAATGRRKTAVARIELSPGTGVWTINRRPVEAYFPTEALRSFMFQPLRIVNQEKQYDLRVFVSGGGLTGQAGAVRHALSRALVTADASLREALKAAGCLTRDPRMKERKKPGQPGARRRFQFSKR